MNIKYIVLGIIILVNAIDVLYGKSAPEPIGFISINPFSPTYLDPKGVAPLAGSLHNHGVEEGSYFMLSQDKDGKPQWDRIESKSLYQASTDMRGEPSRTPAPYMPRGDSEYSRIEDYLPERDIMIGGEILTDKVAHPIAQNTHAVQQTPPGYNRPIVQQTPPGYNQLNSNQHTPAVYNQPTSPPVAPKVPTNTVVHPGVPIRSLKPARTPPQQTSKGTPIRPAPTNHVPGNAQYYVHHSTTKTPTNEPQNKSNVNAEDIKKHLKDHTEQSVNFYYRLHELVSSTLGVILLAFFGLIAFFTLVGIVFSMWKCVFSKKFGKKGQNKEEPLTRNLIVDEINNVSHDDNNPYAFQYQTM